LGNCDAHLKNFAIQHGTAAAVLPAIDAAVAEDVATREEAKPIRDVVGSRIRHLNRTLKWDIPAGIPLVWAEPHGLQQAFLNLAQNSHRAVHAEPVRELFIAVTHLQGRVCVTFQDSGPGVSSPDNLFRPFQQGAHGAGLGLYVSRFLVRAFGGDLRFEPSPSGSRFIVELDPAL